ncbi:DUF3134 family protein [Pantanalinema sp. GBBB05]|uniref:DUF3134 family protein n=1 Tax=Pantanalinema sp. GBBB05 TaxID=2604139 RepID=UPI001DF5D2B1|nr:DUF3134 domain-containing protein [Pantanalinema sp. GBBB05]
MKEKIITPPCYNPSLSEEPRNQRIKVVPPVARESLLSWLESSGRLHSSEESDDLKDYKMAEDINDFLDPELYPLDEEEDQEEQL